MTLFLSCGPRVRKSKYEILTSTFRLGTPSKIKLISHFPSDATKGLKKNPYFLIAESTHYLSPQAEITRALFMDSWTPMFRGKWLSRPQEGDSENSCGERSASTGACDFSFYYWHGGVSSSASAWVIFHPEIAEWYTELGKWGMSWRKKHHVPHHSKLPS